MRLAGRPVPACASAIETLAQALPAPATGAALAVAHEAEASAFGPGGSDGGSAAGGGSVVALGLAAGARGRGAAAGRRGARPAGDVAALVAGAPCLAAQGLAARGVRGHAVVRLRQCGRRTVRLGHERAALLGGDAPVGHVRAEPDDGKAGLRIRVEPLDRRLGDEG